MHRKRGISVFVIFLRQRLSYFATFHCQLQHNFKISSCQSRDVEKIFSSKKWELLYVRNICTDRILKRYLQKGWNTKFWTLSRRHRGGVLLRNRRKIIRAAANKIVTWLKHKLVKPFRTRKLPSCKLQLNDASLTSTIHNTRTTFCSSKDFCWWNEKAIGRGWGGGPSIELQS